MELWKRIKNLFAASGGPAPNIKLGRNDPCWCGSGKKYKRCHYDTDLAASYRKLNSAINCGTKG